MIIDTNQPSEVLTAELTKGNTSEDNCMVQRNRINQVKPVTGFTFLNLFGLLECLVMWLISMPVIKV